MYGCNFQDYLLVLLLRVTFLNFNIRLTFFACNNVMFLSLNSYKKQLGCKWGPNGGCSETCPFVRTVLGLDQVPYRFLFKQQPTIQEYSSLIYKSSQHF